MLRRIFAGLLLLLILALATVYIFIPANISINNNITVTTTDADVFQFLTHQKEWKKWWPGTATSDFEYQYRKHLYTIKQFNNDDVILTVANPKLELNTQLSFIATDADKVKLTWSSVETVGLNPIDRFNTYVQMNRIKNDMNEVLLHFKYFLEDDRNIYQMDVRITKVKDATILATNIVTQQYPEMNKVYELVGKLKQEIRKQHVAETGAPMLNVHQIDLKKYQVMVGIPITKAVKPATGMLINKMVLGGNLLETSIKGGLNTTQNAFNQLEKYKKDHKLISPAMPYESLVTDRSKEKDTSKWVTKIYYPIF